MIEIRARDDGDGSGPSEPYLVPADRLSLADVMALASNARLTVDVIDGSRYLVSYCGGGPYWWLPGTHGGGMHQISSHGWCHECHSRGLGYVHHLDYDTELAVLTAEAREDRVLASQCEADGTTPEEYAASVAGRAVPLDGDCSFTTHVYELGVNADGLAEFGVQMWDMTCWKVAVPVAPGAPRAAEKLAEEMAYAAGPRRCHDCHGLRSPDGDKARDRHSRQCSVTRDREFLAKYPHLRTKEDD